MECFFWVVVLMFVVVVFVGSFMLLLSSRVDYVCDVGFCVVVVFVDVDEFGGVMVVSVGCGLSVWCSYVV